jgi:hypothetical protein
MCLVDLDAREGGNSVGEAGEPGERLGIGIQPGDIKIFA